MKYKEIIEKMTLEEKASLMSGKNFWETVNIDRLNIPSIFLADGPTGLRKQKAAADHLGLNEAVKATCFPTSATLANSWDPLLIETVASILGTEAVAERVSVVLGPGTNIKRNPLAGRNFEYYSEDPYLAGKSASAFIRGIQSHGIAASVKHFAANSQELRRMSTDSVVDERTLREIYLTPFEMAVKEGKTKTVMASYNLVNGTYANENQHLLKDILRDEWDYKGIVVSDWGGVNDRVASLEATAELEMPNSGGDTNKEVLEAVKNGKISESILDEAIDRLLELTFETHKSFENKPQTFDVELHHMVSQLAAEESMVLLKNEDKILPLLKGQSVSVIGDFARLQRFQGAGSSGVNPTKLDSILEQLHDTDFKFKGFEQGFDRYGKKSKSKLNKAVKLAKNTEVVLMFLGLDEFSETEGLDRPHMRLAQNQIDVLEAVSKVNKNIVVILSTGAPIEMDWDKYAKAVLHAYLPGQAGARAVLNILTGAVNPSAKLAETYPVKYSDGSSANYFPGRENTVEYRESLFVGYRYFDTAAIDVKYPFGHGLSYSNFEYRDLNVSNEGVTFKVKNTGSVTGKEIAQLYIGKKDSLLLRPKKELKGFSKIKLEYNQEVEVFIPFDDYTFRYFNTKTNHWEIEPGQYQIYVGSSSTDIRLENHIEKQGKAVDMPYKLSDLPTYQSLNIGQIPDNEFRVLLEREIPNPHFVFYKKKRMKVDYNTTVQQLRYARGWTGRTFAGAVRLGYNVLLFFGARKPANVMQMALYHNPMRNISRLTGGAVSWKQLDALIEMFNGHFFKGLHHFFKAGRARKREQKQLKKNKAKV